MYHCFKCGTPWESSLRQPAVKEVCDKCGSYLHCCKNCTHHRKGYPNECYIPDTEKIADKSHTNFCDEFEFVSDTTLAKRERGGQQNDEALENLFGSTTSPTQSTPHLKDWPDTSDKQKRGFEDLFED